MTTEGMLLGGKFQKITEPYFYAIQFLKLSKIEKVLTSKHKLFNENSTTNPQVPEHV